ncbi:hypothetical protein [Kineococcus auxinigenes]|uniref:hypothetical protein n=1 Tax=unclassified Kineococcus TaxID=2621656 RepID=UPI003D7E7265
MESRLQRLPSTSALAHHTPGRNEVRIHSRGTLNEQLVDTAIADLQQVRQQLPD